MLAGLRAQPRAQGKLRAKAPEAQVQPSPATREVSPMALRTGAEGRLLGLLGPAPVGEDVLIRTLGLPASAVAEVLLELELAGHVSRHPGGLVSLPA